MVRINRFLTILLLAALILSACQPIQPVAPGTADSSSPSAQGPSFQPQRARSDAPAYGVRGPYAVGVRDVVIEPTKNVTIQASLWARILGSADNLICPATIRVS